MVFVHFEVEIMPPSPGQKRILVVDDEATIRYIVTETLREAGYACLPASDGQEAIAVLDVYQPDAIILDLQMPKVDGWGFLAQLRATCLRAGQALPPVCIMTAGWRARDAAKDLQISVWLSKPFSLDELRSVVQTMVQRADAPPAVLEGA